MPLAKTPNWLPPALEPPDKKSHAAQNERTDHSPPFSASVSTLDKFWLSPEAHHKLYFDFGSPQRKSC